MQTQMTKLWLFYKYLWRYSFVQTTERGNKSNKVNIIYIFLIQKSENNEMKERNKTDNDPFPLVITIIAI